MWALDILIFPWAITKGDVSETEEVILHLCKGVF